MFTLMQVWDFVLFCFFVYLSLACGLFSLGCSFLTDTPNNMTGIFSEVIKYYFIYILQTGTCVDLPTIGQSCLSQNNIPFNIGFELEFPQCGGNSECIGTDCVGALEYSILYIFLMFFSKHFSGQEVAVAIIISAFTKSITHLQYVYLFISPCF